MRPPDVEHRPGVDETTNSSAVSWLHPGRHTWRFAVTVAAGWGVIVAALATVARLTTSGETQPSWGEVVGVALLNSVMVLVVAVAVGLIVRLVTRLGGADRRVIEGGSAREGGIWAWSVRGRSVAPTTTEGRFAVVASLLGWVPFFAGPALFATPVLLILAWRRGDRAWSLLLPALATLFLVAFVAAEFLIGHD
jgi:hypothetical protein